MNRKKANELILNAKSITVVRTDRLGDMILTLPMFNVLRKVNPSAQLSLIARTYTEPLFKGIEQIDSYFLADKDEQYKQIIINNNFDVIFFPMMKFEELLPAFKKGIKLRIGSGYRVYSPLLNFKIYHSRKKAEKNESQYNLDLISGITGKEYKVDLIAPLCNKELYINDFSKLVDNKYIIIHPGGAGSAPKWNVDNFGKLAKRICSVSDLGIIVTGGEVEYALCERVCEICSSAVNLCGLLNMEELITLISNSSGLISNSTGVLHIAASYNKKILGFYPNSPAMSSLRWGPMNEQNKILTPKYEKLSDLDNMDLISVDDAFQGFMSIFEI